MQQVIIEMRLIEDHFANAKYDDAYRGLHDLCSNNELCSEFSSAATSIFSRFNDLKNSIMHGALDLTQQDNKKSEIRASFQLLIENMKSYFGSGSKLCYENHVLQLMQKHKELRNTLYTIEDDLENCTHDAKSNLLLEIIGQLNAVIRYFSTLIQNFKTVQSL